MQYDLGIACLEMGQVNGAIDAFRRASKDPARACVSLSMIATANRSVGQLDAALNALHEAASVQRKPRSEEADGTRRAIACRQASRSRSSPCARLSRRTSKTQSPSCNDTLRRPTRSRSRNRARPRSLVHGGKLGRARRESAASPIVQSLALHLTI